MRTYSGGIGHERPQIQALYMIPFQEMERASSDVSLTHANRSVENNPRSIYAQRLHGLHHELALESPLGAFILPFCLFERSPLFADRQNFADDLLELVERLLQEGYELGGER